MIIGYVKITTYNDEVYFGDLFEGDTYEKAEADAIATFGAVKSLEIGYY